jgi:RimJ/RimL family protein N-acetyltransferase
MLEPLRTERLLLRDWREADREPFARLNADPLVMEHFPGVLSAEASGLLMDRIVSQNAERGFGLYAVELRETGDFIGFIGLAVPSFSAHFTPCVEIGWRLAAAAWGRGFATEGARDVAQYAFTRLGLTGLVSFTASGNLASRRVMEKLGMTHDVAEDFMHPGLPAGHPLAAHVLYRLRGPSLRRG